MAGADGLCRLHGPPRAPVHAAGAEVPSTRGNANVRGVARGERPGNRLPVASSAEVCDNIPESSPFAFQRPYRVGRKPAPTGVFREFGKIDRAFCFPHASVHASPDQPLSVGVFRPLGVR